LFHGPGEGETTKPSINEGFDFSNKRFFVEGESRIKYTYNNGHIAKDPKLASTSFLKALERIPILIDNHERILDKAVKNIPVLEEVVNSQWRKEDELRKLKSDLAALDRKIQMTIGDNSIDSNRLNDILSSQFSPGKKVVEVPEPKTQFRVPYRSRTFDT
jgi:hypothetical protein